jgi:hypothetical protein
MLKSRVNSIVLAILISCLAPLRAQNPTSLTARDYYKELYGAGGLDYMAGGHACFQDDPKIDSFFTFRESKNLRDHMLADGTFSKLPDETQGLINKDFLMVRGYAKGIPWKGEEFLEKDEETWISDQRMLDERTPIRIRFNINWETLRYKYAVEVLNMDSSIRSEAASFGICEEIPTETRGLTKNNR